MVEIENMDNVGCVKDKHIIGEFLEPAMYLKIINHPLRKHILNKLFQATTGGPVRKKYLAKELGIAYPRLVYQLNEHLNSFWEVVREEKIRGAREELISPVNHNTIYCTLSGDATIHIVDPLANLFGRLNIVGTRCDRCDLTQQQKCIKRMMEQGCADNYFKPEERKDILVANNRKTPYTPVDYMLLCTITSILDVKKCVVSPKQV